MGSRLLRLVGILLVAGLGYVGFLAATWPDVAALASSPPETTAFIERYRERALEEGLPEPAFRWVPYSAISSHLKQAVVVAEDIDFFSHRGFAWDQIRVAVEETLEEGKPLRGASTLTQQLAKNLWLTPSRNPLRKIEEAVLTWQLERELGKRRILELYVNVVELGPGVYGAEAAAQRYFGCSAAELGPDESAALAAGLPRSTWYPGVGSSGYRGHIARIRGRMDRARWVMGEL